MRARRVLQLLGVSAAVSAALAVAAPSTSAPSRGEQIYARCVACHAIDTNRTGPQHCGLFGRRAGTAPGYADYSKAMRASRVVWSDKTLNAFLENPMQYIPGTSMGYAGIKDTSERAELIAWLRESTQPTKACTVSR